jgi:hypothetical protein
VGLPRWPSPLHENDTATYSPPPVQIPHKPGIRFQKQPTAFCFNIFSRLFPITFRSSYLFSSVSSHTVFYREEYRSYHMALWYCIPGFRFSWQFLLHFCNPTAFCFNSPGRSAQKLGELAAKKKRLAELQRSLLACSHPYGLPGSCKHRKRI